MNLPIMPRRYALGALLLCMLGVSFFAQAKDFTVVEIASLPQYCQDKLNRRNEERWVSTFGHDNWIHLHHYCYGLIRFSRASTAIDRQRRSVNTKIGIRQFDYVLNRWPANFSLYQLAQMYKTQLEMMRNLN